VWPFEVLLVPRQHAARIDELDVAQRDGLVHDMQRLMRRYDGLFGHPLPYSMGWHQAPFGAADEAHWQVHAHFLPPNLEPDRRKFMVGYELLSEPQRDITAEDAAAQLRAVDLDAGSGVMPGRAAAGAGGG
jgi:UDPglucose--hexose-1-phosphate uridylyltransferase